MNVMLNRLIEETITIANIEDSIEEVLTKMGTFTAIPVTDKNGIYMGIVSKLDIFEKEIEGIDLPEIKTAEIVKEHPSITQEDDMGILLEKLKNAKHLFMPLVKEETNELIGIIPNQNILKLFENSIAAKKEGEEIVIICSDYIGLIRKITNILAKSKINIITLNILDVEVMNSRRIVLKVDGTPEAVESVKKLLKKKGFDVR